MKINQKCKIKFNFQTDMAYSMDFKVTDDMVRKFAVLTGDYSSLHMDEMFARRSVYRENVVQGLLPIMFISFLGWSQFGDSVFFLKEISSNFLKPIFIEDTLTLNAKLKEIKNAEGLLKFEYVIKNRKSNSNISLGIFILEMGKRDEEGETVDLSVNDSSTMVAPLLEERTFSLDEISEGDKDAFDFIVSESSKRCLYEILKIGSLNKNNSDLFKWENSFDPKNFLVSALISTFAGMRIPGRYASILNLNMVFNRNILLQKKYRFEGEVAFKSSASSITENIVLYGDNKISGKGTVNVRINEKPVKMMDIKTIKEKGLDLGLKDKVVLITGASRGIGEVTAKLFALHGSKVVINYFRGKEDALRIVKEIEDNGGEAFAVQTDVSSCDEVKEMVKAVLKEYDAIHVLVNNAVRNFTAISFSELTWDELQKDIDVTVKGAFNCCKEIIPVMVKNGGGRIINLSSIAVDNPPPNQMKYVISKSALTGLTRSLAVEFASENVLVNMVAPNMVKTDLTSGIPKAFADAMANEIPMKRISSPLDTARAVLYLASSLSSYTTGQKIMVTGGSLPFL